VASLVVVVRVLLESDEHEEIFHVVFDAVISNVVVVVVVVVVVRLVME